jgi:hypothetical protein
MLRDAFDRWKDALVDQNKQTTRAARHRAHARVTSMEDLIAETPADDIEGVGIKLALYVYMSGVDPEKADSAVEQVLSAKAIRRKVPCHVPQWGRYPFELRIMSLRSATAARGASAI